MCALIELWLVKSDVGLCCFFIFWMLTVLQGTHWWSLEWLEAPTPPSPVPPPPLNDINNRDFVNHPVRKYSNGINRFSWNIPDKKQKNKQTGE